MILTEEFVNQTYDFLKTSKDPINGGELSPSSMAFLLLVRLAAGVKGKVSQAGFLVMGPNRAFPAKFLSPAPDEETPAIAISRRSNDLRPEESIHIWIEEVSGKDVSISDAEQVFKMATEEEPKTIGSISFKKGSCVMSDSLIQDLCSHIDQKLSSMGRNDKKKTAKPSGPSLG